LVFLAVAAAGLALAEVLVAAETLAFAGALTAVLAVTLAAATGFADFDETGLVVAGFFVAAGLGAGLAVDLLGIAVLNRNAMAHDSDLAMVHRP
jgi:hypothetical protein